MTKTALDALISSPEFQAAARQWHLQQIASPWALMGHPEDVLFRRLANGGLDHDHELKAAALKRRWRLAGQQRLALCGDTT